mgnify:CR=1 FL=1
MPIATANPKKIFIYCESWAQGGIETFLAHTLEYMDCSGMQIELACAEKQTSRLDEELAAIGLSVRTLVDGKERSALRRTIAALLPFARRCRRERYDVVHLNVFHGVALLLALVARLNGVHHVIVHCHGAGFRSGHGEKTKIFVHHFFCKLLAWTPTERWAASERAGRFMFGSRSVRIIPNGVDVKKFRFDPQERQKLRADLKVEDRLVFGCVGRMDTQKNQAFLLPLFEQLQKSEYKPLLLLFGDGEEYASLKLEIEKMGITESARLMGISSEVHRWMWAMDALLVPSTSEGLGIVVIEGQAAGLPVLCSTGVPQETKLTQNVQFLSLESPDQWLKAMKKVPVTDRLKMNREIEESRYDIRKSAAMVRAGYLAE